MLPLRTIFVIAALVHLVSCQHAPLPDYVEKPHIVARRLELREDLLQLLPENQRAQAAAEATWLADTAYKASAAIARYNDPVFVNWLNNRAVNTRNHYRHRGLCWHYQHDLYRELRRRPLQYFRIGCCVRDKGKGGEHHVVYVTGRNKNWPSVIMLDAWWSGGRLVVENENDTRGWIDDPRTCLDLSGIYPEGHTLPMEHWAMIRRSTRYGDYVYSHLPTARNTPQWNYMQQQMRAGMKRRNGKPTDY